MKKSIFAVAFFLFLFASPTCLKAEVIGDIDGDGKTGLADVILALQVLTKTGAAGINMGADVDGDKRIGLAEAIYTMQLLAEARILPLTFPLESGGSILIPQEAIPAEAQVSIEKFPLPVMPEDLEAVGSAYFVQADSELLLPATVKLPIPEGEDPEKLVIIRLEDNGEISMLETQVEGEFLVARTAEFSALYAARWKNKFASIRPVINGPDFLPGNAGPKFEYYEARYARASQLDRKWTYYLYDYSKYDEDEDKGEIKLETDENIATISFPKPVKIGRLELQVELTEPWSGHKVIAFKSISIQDKDDVGAPLSLKIDAPAVIEKGKFFGILVEILNLGLDKDRPISWNWSLPGALPADKANGSCTAPCDPKIVLGGLYFLTPGQYRFNVSASTWLEGPEGKKIPDREGEASATLFVDEGLALDYLTVPNPVWNPSRDTVSVTAEAAIWGGRPAFTYLWTNKPDMLDPDENRHDNRTDTYELIYKQPGIYVTDLRVADLHGSTFVAKRYVPVVPIEKMEMLIENLPDEEKVNKEITITVKVTGGALIWYGKKYGYDILINWGDKKYEEEWLDSSSSVQWAEIQLRHTYEDPGDYEITIGGWTGWKPDLSMYVHSWVTKESNIKIVQDDTFHFPSDFPIKDICPESIDGLSSYARWCEGQSEDVYKTYNLDSLYDYGPIAGLHQASCDYKLPSPDKDCDIFKARSLDLFYSNYPPNDNGCNKGDEPFQFPGSETVYSTKRMLRASAPSGIKNPVPKLRELITKATKAGVGAPCPPP